MSDDTHDSNIFKIRIREGKRVGKTKTLILYILHVGISNSRKSFSDSSLRNNNKKILKNEKLVL